MKKIYKWQKIIIWIIGVLTFLSITAKVVGEEIFVGYFIDVVLGVAINVFVLFSIFSLGNWIYKKYKKEK